MERGVSGERELTALRAGGGNLAEGRTSAAQSLGSMWAKEVTGQGVWKLSPET